MTQLIVQLPSSTLDWPSLSVFKMSRYLSSNFPDFRPNPQASIRNVFKRLAREQGWAPGTVPYNTERRNFLQSVFDHYLGDLDQPSNLLRLQALCRELGLHSVPDSITKCKQVSEKPKFRRGVAGNLHHIPRL